MKNKMIDLAFNYFQGGGFYFWKWAEKGEVIEWKNGGTICYREDLVQLLKKLEPHGFASLDAILLVLAACKNSWKEDGNKEGLLSGILAMLQVSLDEEQKQVLEDYLKRSIRALNMIGELPEQQRKGDHRIHLLHVLFSNTRLRLPAAPSKQILAIFETGEYDDVIFNQKKNILADKFKLDLGCIIDVLSPYKSVKELSNQLKTGLKNIPEAEEIELPEQESESLLTQLAKDDKTHGLSNLTQRLMAALHIPMHTEGVSDQAYGGISDISNRGDFDRLLLSELAYDETSLIARLVNNEALYYHHEAPPVQQYQHRTILLDATIKMWGLPRIFGLSAALACTQNVKEEIEIAAFSMSGTHYQALDLTTKDGVLEAMEELDAHLDCSRALLDFFQNQNPVEGIENVFVTTEEAFKSNAFIPHLSFLQERLDYLITVNRSGGLQFFQLNHGKRKLLNSLQLNLKEHLFPPRKVEKKHHVDKRLPAFCQKKHAPLYFPIPSSKLTKHNTFVSSDKDIITITSKKRVLLWPSGDEKGAREILGYIEGGIYYFGQYSKKIYILVHNQKFVKLYGIDLLNLSVISKDYSEQVQVHYRGVNFVDKYFYIPTYPNSFLINVETQDVLEQPFHDMRTQLGGNVPPYHNQVNFNLFKKLVNSSYSTLQKPKRVYIGTSGYLTIGGHQIQLFMKNLQLIDKTFGKQRVIYPVEKIEETGVLDNQNIKFCRSIFADGSEAIVDSRGLLHLRSSNNEIGEISIVLIIGQMTGAWSSASQTVCGNHHFYSHIASPQTSELFYEKFIQSFIDEIRKKRV